MEHPKLTTPKPKLDRLNAGKNIEYHPSPSPPPDAPRASATKRQQSDSHRLRSLLLDPKASFRIKGIEGEFDLFCETLGFSGPEDFAIPTAVWEAQKARLHSSPRVSQQEPNIILKQTQEPRVRVTHKAPPNRINEEQVSNSRSAYFNSVRTIRDGSRGIKGDRPAILAAPPPPVMLVPVDDVEIEDSDCFNGGGSEEEVEEEEEDRKTGAAIVHIVHCVSPNAIFRRNIKSWQKGELLGSGSFGTVFEGFTDDGFFFAVKEVSLLDQGSQGKQSLLQLEQEISLLREFEHDNIVRYLGTDKDEGKLYIFLELATKGSLARLYQKYHLRDSQVSAYTRQILNGLRYLHDRGVLHRDIKCANILVDANGSVKLADFGLAKATQSNDIKSCKGTAFWMAPEVVNLKNRTYGLAADIWSLGCSVLEMLTGRPPYSHLEGMQAIYRIGKGEPPLVPDTLSKDAQDFIHRCLQVNPNNRPTAVQLLDHPFVKRPIQHFSVPPSPRFFNSPQKF
ncbi:Mitogen-activated protein kinase kinase kinase 1 [Euphorbia peplus]|nr:Mitogen-activated protein kinase kinase kinase 1 [Euphorbia peplus]